MNFPLSPKDDSKMHAAFEMNLDVTSSPVSPASPASPESKQHQQQQQQHGTETSKNLFKMLVSPKFARKSPAATSSPASSGGGEGVGGSAGSAGSAHLLSPPTPTRIQKTLLGSPRLHRAIFGPKKTRKMSSGSVDSVSLNSSTTSEFNSPRFSPSRRPLNRPPPLVSPPSPSTGGGGNSSSVFYDDSSCPGTPKTPLKPAMGVSMIGKQRTRVTPTGVDSPFSPPLSSPTSSTERSTHFTYTVPAGSNAGSSAGSSAGSPKCGELEYPPVFEPGSYSLADKKVRSPPLLPPVPAPRTKFLTTSASRLHPPPPDSLEAENA